MNTSRATMLERNTRETQIRVELDVDGTGQYAIETGIPFFNHMLELFAKHSLFDLNLKATGDPQVAFRIFSTSFRKYTRPGRSAGADFASLKLPGGKGSASRANARSARKQQQSAGAAIAEAFATVGVFPHSSRRAGGNVVSLRSEPKWRDA